MSIRMKLAAAAGALALVSFLAPTAAEAADDVPYGVGASQNTYNISCRAGASSGTAPIKLRVTRAIDGVAAAQLGNTDGETSRWVATWQGGSGSVTMTKPDVFYSASKGATFPCPTTQSESGQFTITVKSYTGTVENDDPAHINVVVRRVGSASGPAAVGVGGVELVTEVLGLRLDDPNGPAPVGGVRTGAGGTSDASNNLLPLGAGIGFAGLAAAVMIRRRRCPAV